MVSETPKLLFDRRSAAATLSISVRSPDYYIARRELRIIRMGRKVLIPASELKQFARTNHYEPVVRTSRAADDATRRKAA